MLIFKDVILQIYRLFYKKLEKILKLNACNDVENLYVIKDLVSLEKISIRIIISAIFTSTKKSEKKLYKVKLYYIAELYDISSLKNLNI